MKMRNVYLIFLLVLTAGMVQAQSNLEGVVLDAVNHHVLVGASIQSGDHLAKTNNKGVFSIPLSQGKPLIISYIGYEVLMDKNIPSNAAATYYLKPLENALSDVLVTNTSNSNHSTLYQPSSITVVNKQDLNRATGLYLDDAIQTNVPGVAMARRSVSGGQQFNIRGYGNGTRGTRGVSSNFDGQGYKVYLNGIPLTDAEGITTMDDIDFASIANVEIIKGPAGTLYGQAIAGAVHLSSVKAEKNKTSLSQQIMIGDYGLRRNTTTLQSGTDHASLLINYGNQQSSGYTIHNASKKDFVNVLADFETNAKNNFHVYAGYSNSADQRAGELTITQFETNDFSGNPDYIKRDGHSNVTTFRTGISHVYTPSNQFNFTNTIFGTGFSSNASSAAGWTDKSTLNYGIRSSINTKFELSENIHLSGVTGVEMQQQTGQVIGYSMKQSPLDNATTWTLGVNPYWVINATTSNVFATTRNNNIFTDWTLSLPKEFSVVGGIGIGKVGLNLNDRFNSMLATRPNNFDTSYASMVTPHFALNKVINKHISVYASYSTGFKAPTSSYFYITTPAVTTPATPATGSLNHLLSPEKGAQFELGTKGQLFNNQLSYEFAYFNTVFSKKMTAISVVSPASPTTTLYSYVVNGGNQNHRGVEGSLKYTAFHSNTSVIRLVKPFANFTYANFTYGDHFTIQKSVTLTEDYSGKMVAGVPKYVVNAGVDLDTKFGIYANLTYNYKDKLPITSMNDYYATSYSLWNGKLGYQVNVSKQFNMDCYVGVTNILGVKYPMMVFANQIPDTYLAAPLKPVVFGGLNFVYNFK